MVGIVAALGIMTTVLVLARERVHGLGVYDAIGMPPGSLRGGFPV